MCVNRTWKNHIVCWNLAIMEKGLLHCSDESIVTESRLFGNPTSEKELLDFDMNRGNYTKHMCVEHTEIEHY